MALFTGTLAAANTANFSRNVLGGERRQKIALIYEKIVWLNNFSVHDYRTDQTALIANAVSGFAGRTPGSIEASRIWLYAKAAQDSSSVAIPTSSSVLSNAKKLLELPDQTLLQLDVYLDGLVFQDAGWTTSSGP